MSENCGDVLLGTASGNTKETVERDFETETRIKLPGP
jgi:hypothetical protein